MSSLSYSYAVDQPSDPKLLLQKQIKPGTTPLGTGSGNIPPNPTIPSGGHGPPSGGIGNVLSPPKQPPGAAAPPSVPRMPSININAPVDVDINAPVNVDVDVNVDPRFRDRGFGPPGRPVPHPHQVPTETGRHPKDLKPNRGEGDFFDRFRDTFRLKDRNDDDRCNRGVRFDDGHFEFRFCDRDRHFLGNGRGDRIEDAIEDARRRSGRFDIDIFDFERGYFIQPYAVPIVPYTQFYFPVSYAPPPLFFGGPGYPYGVGPVGVPQPQYPTTQPTPPMAPAPPPPPDMGAPPPSDGGGGGGGGLFDSLKSIPRQYILLGVGLVVLLIIFKK